MSKRFKKVYIEISNVCNLQCTFCPEVVRDKAFMPPDLFQHAVRSVAPLADEVCFHLMGEPLLHPQFESYLEFCRSLGQRVNLTTNGILLDEKRMHVLLNPALSQINFSLQAFSDNFPERDNADYLGRIFQFTEQAIRERPELYINYRLWNDGTSEAPAMNAEIIEKISQGLHVAFDPATDIRWKKSTKIKSRVYLHRDSRFAWPSVHDPVRSTAGFCYGLSSHIGILADGTVVPCCLDKEGVIRLGNCRSQSIEQILQSPRVQTMHDGFKNGILVEDLCQKCTFIGRFDNKRKRVTLPQ